MEHMTSFPAENTTPFLRQTAESLRQDLERLADLPGLLPEAEPALQVDVQFVHAKFPSQVLRNGRSWLMLSNVKWSCALQQKEMDHTTESTS